jgi:hypothetical protein
MIGSDGVFEAGSEEGNFLMTAGAGGKSATAVVVVAKEPAPPPPPPEHPTRLIWSGDVAPQKWSQLYMKVLSKLVSGGEVRLRVDIEATLDNGPTDQRLDETKAALRELGLNDDVKAE